MRIIGGKWRGTALAGVGMGDPAAHLRPTSDKVRESLFNVLEHGPYPTLKGIRVLDLFAGTGALGFEALSRGAETVHFIDNGPRSLALLRENTGRLSAAAQVRVTRRNATRPGANAGPGYELVFLDPPYGKALGEAAMAAAQSGGWLAPGALIVWEEGGPITPPPRLTLRDERRYGDTWIRLLEAEF
ncbi:MAG: 16S rRNA (guanine(966)-N(2))-methyltransferase RsmD [Pseudomonadota bacterium]